MDDAAGMGMIQRARDFTGDSHRLLDPELDLDPQSIAQRSALDIRHHVPQPAIVGAGIEQRQDGGVVESGGEADLSEEALRAEDGGQLGMEHLESDGPTVPEVLGQIDGGHTAVAELAFDRVARLQAVVVRWSRHPSPLFR